MNPPDATGARRRVRLAGREVEVVDLSGLALDRLPYAVRLLVENLLRREDGRTVTRSAVDALLRWPEVQGDAGVSFLPARVLMQDFTGVPAIADLVALRDAVEDRGGDTSLVRPVVPVDLVIDHSIVADSWGVPDAFARNRATEYAQNAERYAFLRWAQGFLDGLRVFPPNSGICHQVNLEHLAQVVLVRDGVAMPDTVLGTDSHTPMVNGLGVLGWGVGGIEAEAAVLGVALDIPVPEVVALRLDGELRPGVTATDLVLTVAEALRAHGVVGKIVEVVGPGVANLAVPERATIANMTPEYGATATLFPIDEQTLDYLRATARDDDHIALVEAYAKHQGLWGGAGPDAIYRDTIELDLAVVEPSISGPSRPQDRVPLSRAPAAMRAALARALPARTGPTLPPRPSGVPAEAPVSLPDGRVAAATSPEESSAESFPASDPPASGAAVAARSAGPTTSARGAAEQPAGGEGFDLRRDQLDHGSVVIAAITSCTNTSNPTVLVTAGLLARNARRRGLRPRPWVKTSFAPGSLAVPKYLGAIGVLEDLAALGFDVVGYGCTTCIGNSGVLPEQVSAEIAQRGLSVSAVLSGNRNFEGRIHPDVRMNWLASPPLVVAYALAGSLDVDLAAEPVGVDDQGRDVHLAELWPTAHEVAEGLAAAADPGTYRATYRDLLAGDDAWRALPEPAAGRYAWEPTSTYLRRPPFLDDEQLAAEAGAIAGARVLALLGDSVTTDHISPAGVIKADSPAGRWLREHGVEPAQFNSYGSRRGNHEVMVRGTFANTRLRNALAGGREGGWTRHLPDGELCTIFDAAVRYAAERVPLVVVAGREYGSGSSRDWAAKGTRLLGVRAVLAESYERIHRSNLVGMGVLPLEFLPGQGAAVLGLTGEEQFTIDTSGIDARRPTAEVALDDGRRFEVRVRLDAAAERDLYRSGGILPRTLRRALASS